MIDRCLSAGVQPDSCRLGGFNLYQTKGPPATRHCRVERQARPGQAGGLEERHGRRDKRQSQRTDMNDMEGSRDQDQHQDQLGKEWADQGGKGIVGVCFRQGAAQMVQRPASPAIPSPRSLSLATSPSVCLTGAQDRDGGGV